MHRIFQIDPALRDKSGHHFNYCLSIAEEARARRMPVFTLCNTYGTDADIDTVLNGYGVFEMTQDDVIFEKNSPVQSAGAFNTYFATILNRILTPLVADGDIVLFHALTSTILLAVADWMTRNQHRDIRMGVFLMYPEYMDFPSQALNWRSDIYRMFLHRLTQLERSKMWLVAETTEIANDMAALSGGALAFEEAPHFKPAGPLQKIAALPFDPGKSPVRVGYLGYGIPKRGTPIVPEIVHTATAALEERVAFTIHVNMKGYAYWRDECPQMRQQLRSIESLRNVTLMEGALSSDAFYDAFGGADVILLPYRDEYARCGSGQFFEALAAGKLPVVPADTYMAREIERLGGACVTFDEFSAASAAAAVIEAVERFAELAPKAREAGLKWQEDHHPSRAIDRVLASFDGNAG